MQDNPYEKFDTPSDYHLPGDDEQARLKSIEQRVEILGTGRRRIMRFIGIAAAAALVLIAGLWLIPASSDQLAQSYFEPYKNYQTEKVRGEQAEAYMKEAYQAYNEQKFGAAAKAFEAAGKELTSLDRLYHGISLAGAGQWSEVLPVFSKIGVDFPPEHLDALEWYTALAFLANKETKNGKEALQKIVDKGNSYYHEKAKGLLKKL